MMIVMKGGEITEKKEIFWCKCNALLSDRRDPMSEPMEYTMQFVVEDANKDDAIDKANTIIYRLGFDNCGLKDIEIIKTIVKPE